MSEQNSFTMYVPHDLLAQFGDFEKSVITQRDAKVTNFIEPFGTSTSLERSQTFYWVFSNTAQRAFKVCKQHRKIIDYAEI